MVAVAVNKLTGALHFYRQLSVKIGQDRARRHEIRAQRAKVSSEALRAREKMAMDLLKAQEAAIKARKAPEVANNPAAADAAAVAAAIDVLGPDSADRVERLHLRGALGNANRRRHSNLSVQSV